MKGYRLTKLTNLTKRIPSVLLSAIILLVKVIHTELIDKVHKFNLLTSLFRSLLFLLVYTF